MTKKKESKPKHSLDSNRGNGTGGVRSSATVKRLSMYTNRPKRDKKGKILKHDYQSPALPSTRIVPDRRWFDNTKVIGQKQLEFFRTNLEDHLSSNYTVVLK